MQPEKCITFILIKHIILRAVEQEACFPTVVSHVGSLVLDRVAEPLTQPGNGVRSGRMMGRIANLSPPFLAKYARTLFL